MKQFIRTLSSTAIIAVSCCLFSCGDDIEGFGLTGKEGLPSRFKTADKTTYLSYSGNRLLQMMDEFGFTTSFEYEENVLKWVSFAPPADPNIADGHGSTRFEKEGNKILAKSSGEPSFNLYVNEIELDENELPTKITDKGVFQMTSEGEKKLWDGKYYSILTFDTSTKNLLKLEKFNLEDSTLITTYTFKYSSQPGSMSNVELPSWFFAYWYQRNPHISELLSRQFLNNKNTLMEETITDKASGESNTIHYKYSYNDKTYPVSIENGEKIMEIRY